MVRPQFVFPSGLLLLLLLDATSTHLSLLANRYCSASEKEVVHLQHHFKSDGRTLLRPLPCVAAPDGATIDGYWGLCAALAPYRRVDSGCRYLVVVREPIGRVAAEYARYCAASSSNSDSGEGHSGEGREEEVREGKGRERQGREGKGRAGKGREEKGRER